MNSFNTLACLALAVVCFMELDPLGPELRETWLKPLASGLLLAVLGLGFLFSKRRT